MPKDRRVVACNFVERTAVAAPDALAYLSHTSDGALPERVQFLMRSRSGQWVQKHQNTGRLINFRWKTLPPLHPLCGDERVADYFDDERLGDFRRAADLRRA